MPTVVDTHNMTVGCELELSDWSCAIRLPTGFKRSPDYTIVNSNGIAAQPNPKVYPHGGEINTPPTGTPRGQADCLSTLLSIRTNYAINHRSNLHVHVRVPGLGNNLPLLKQVQLYVHEELPNFIDLIEPIPVGVTLAEKKRERRRKVSHHTFLTAQRLKHQLDSNTVREFFEREVPCTKLGRKPMWHAQPRLCVGLRQILQTDTVEFRHFPGTLDQAELEWCVRWCVGFLKYAIQSAPLQVLWQIHKDKPRPVFQPFDEELEIGYQATASHNGLSQRDIKQNIQLILDGKFHASPAYRAARSKANGE